MRMRASIILILTLGLTLIQVASVAAEDTSSDDEDSLDEDQDEDDDDEAEDGDQDKKKAEAAAAPAPTEPAAFSRPISLGLLLGYGFDLANDLNFWGLGLGLRGGYNIRKIYLGGRLVYQFGESREDRALGRVIRDSSAYHFDVGLEGGYDLSPMEHLIVRPEVGLGLVNLTTYFRNTTTETTDSTPVFYFALGATVTYDLTPMFFVGGDTRLQIVAGSRASSAPTSTASNATQGLTFLVHGGMRL